MEAANSSYLVLFFAFLNREILSLENDTNRRIWLFLDEFQTLKTSAGTGLWSIYNLMAEGRQKGASVVISTQSLSQMKLIYGTDGLNSLLSLTSNKYFFQIHDTADQEIVTKLLGKQESKDFLVSTREGNFGGMDNDSFNLGYSVKERSMILPNELSQLKVVVDGGVVNIELYIKLGQLDPCKILINNIHLDTIYEIVREPIKRGFGELLIEKKEVQKEVNNESTELNL
jgi:type IV secretory pathway TraG/TraD family ATPase VirD4